MPTPNAVVDRMLLLARVTPSDLVVDLGSGDGKIVITAAKRFGARARGVEYSADLVETSRRKPGSTASPAARCSCRAISSRPTSATRRS